MARTHWVCSCLFAGGVVFSLQILADSDVRFFGTLLSNPPCTINGGQPIEIDFGEVGVNKVDGQNYAQPFRVIYECEGVSTDKVLRYLGAATAFDKAAVQSNIPEFGIRLQHQKDGITAPFDVGSTLAIPSYLGASDFIATPVKKTGVELQEGAFAAAATLQLEYP
ncbi:MULTISPECIES: fimbrial protein [unclassified Serratia (in: enterobacteria)]|uniref:fimbrial protein n=1 Tax=unclassified Serratia (in: enterobacteria) TaxID=2647522 RepID=UPI002ED3DF7D|nr:fimbrial protein [Serratia sp. C2(2)]MEE4449665.1 fimbrial protein [Serratia sp. C2(1)]